MVRAELTFKTPWLKTNKNHTLKELWFPSTNLTFVLETNFSNLESHYNGVSSNSDALTNHSTKESKTTSLCITGPLSNFWQETPQPICFNLETASQRNQLQWQMFWNRFTYQGTLTPSVNFPGLLDKVMVANFISMALTLRKYFTGSISIGCLTKFLWMRLQYLSHNHPLAPVSKIFPKILRKKKSWKHIHLLFFLSRKLLWKIFVEYSIVSTHSDILLLINQQT